MKLELLLQIISIASDVFGFLGTAAIVVFYAGKFTRRFEDLEANVVDMKGKLSSLSKAFSLLFSSLVGTRTIDRSTTIEIVSCMHVYPTGNPISQEEADKINGYMQQFVNKITFTKEQAADFLLLAEKFESDPDVKKSKQADNAYMIFSIAQYISAGLANKNT